MHTWVLRRPHEPILPLNECPGKEDRKTDEIVHIQEISCFLSPARERSKFKEGLLRKKKIIMSLPLGTLNC